MSQTTRIVRRRYLRQKNGRSGSRLFLRLAAAVSLVVAGLVTLVVLAGVAGAASVYSRLTQDLPNFNELSRLGQDVDASFETTKIYAWGRDENGDGHRELVLIYEVIDPLGGDRQWLPLARIPRSLIDATVAIEDRTFWTNRGYDLQGIGRAFYEYVWLGGPIQGGSSITQQLVKNTLIAEERRIVGQQIGLDDYRRKAEEVLLAQQVSQVYSKEQILEWYLNTNFYGNLAYGVEAAARVYFDKPASQLNLAEAAMLAAVPQSPALNPIDNPAEARPRQALVLEAMFREGLISREAMLAAKDFPITVSPGIEQRFDMIAPHFAIHVRKQLEQRFGPEMVLRGGLRVYTSLDLSMQHEAECLARAQVAQLSGGRADDLPADELAGCRALEYLPPLRAADQGLDHNVDNASVVALDPTTGEIRAMVGSLNYWDAAIDGSFNVAVDGLRQPGSSFKPFTYLTAFSQGYTPATMVLDVETDFGGDHDGLVYVPQNYDRRFHGPMRIRQALGNSYNVPAVQVTSWVGVDRVIRTAHSMGITTLDRGSRAYGLALTLGGGEVKLLDMVYAFSVMDNMGVMVGQPVPEEQQRLGYRTLDPVAIIRVEDRNGRILYEFSQPDRREILTRQLAFLINDILSDRAARCAGFGCPNALELPGNRPAAVKTGTTDDFRDAWAIGYTPQLVTGVWVGNTDNSPMVNVPGSKGAAPIWQAFMTWAHQNLPMVGWEQPPGVVRMTVCDVSGLLPTEFCPTVSEYFIEGTQPHVYDNMFQQLRVNRETGRLATIYTPPELVDTRVYVIYPEQAADWVRESDLEQPPQEYDTIGDPEVAVGDVSITSPGPFDYVSGIVPIVGSAQGEGFSYYRLAYFEGLAPDNLHMITEPVTEPMANDVLAEWDVGGLNGLYTLLLTVVRHDGTFEDVTIPLTVDTTPPEARILFPLPNQTFLTGDDWIIVQAQVTDDISVARVEFYVGSAEEPFAVSTVHPFTEKWTIRGPGCHNFRVVAYDAAGNSSEAGPVRACVVARQG
jgi:membrane carboxypeptidase/penicillin-binding protein